MKKAKKVIITCAVTGSLHTPTMSRYLPCTPEEIARAAIEAGEAGAGIIHLHARNPKDGRPTPSAEVFLEFIREIDSHSDVVINLSTGGSPGMTLDQRLEASRVIEPELTSLNMGNVNFALYDLADRYSDWKYDWEKPFLQGMKHSFLTNTYGMMEQVITELHQGFGTRFEYECYEVGHLYTIKFFADRNMISPPYFIQCIFGIPGAIGADLTHLTHMRDTCDRLFGDDYYLSCFAAGRNQMNFLTTCASMGGNVRVGLEDSLYIGRGELAHSNAQQVRKIRLLLEELGYEIASPAEARDMLQLKGAETLKIPAP